MFEYPYFAIALHRPFYHMVGRYFDEDWPMPTCPFRRSDYPRYNDGPRVGIPEAWRREDAHARRIAAEEGPAFQNRQVHHDPTVVGHAASTSHSHGWAKHHNDNQWPGASASVPRRFGQTDVAEEHAFQRTMAESVADMSDATPAVGPGSTPGPLPAGQRAPPAAAGNPPGGAAVEKGYWTAYNNQSRERTSPLVVPTTPPHVSTSQGLLPRGRAPEGV